VNGTVSERALREIYLKGFEIAVKEGGAYAVMSTYGPFNGIYTAGNYDLITTVLRKEWGFDGIVMTDWWADANEEGQKGETYNTPQIVRAQNDLYMVVEDAQTNSRSDLSKEGLEKGIVKRCEFQRIASNICRNLMRMPSFKHFLGEEDEVDAALKDALTKEDQALANAEVVEITCGAADLDVSHIDTGRGATSLYQIFTKPKGIYRLTLTCRAEGSNDLAQIPLSVFADSKLSGMISITGADRKPRDFEFDFEPAFLGSFYLKFYFGQGGMVIDRCHIELKEALEV
jgi:beta-glucosidase